MDIYCSGIKRGDFKLGGKDCFGMKHYLATYSDLRDRTFMATFLAYFEDIKGVDLFLDSGAFSAMSIGVKLNLHEYISFINRYGHMFKIIASLDVIWSPEKSLENYHDIRDHCKYKVIPTFHHTEPWEYLDIYAKETDHIGIGGMASLNTIGRIDFIGMVVKRARKINPKIKFHGFAVGTTTAIQRVGNLIESVDTTRWLSPIKYANIRNRPRMTKNELTRPQLEKFLRHEVFLLMKLENNINELKQALMNEESPKITN